MCRDGIFQFSILIMNMFRCTWIFSVNEIQTVAVLVNSTKTLLKYCKRERYRNMKLVSIFCEYSNTVHQNGGSSVGVLTLRLLLARTFMTLSCTVLSFARRLWGRTRAAPAPTWKALLASYMLRVVQTNPNETFAQVENMVGQASDPVLKGMLNDCSNEYGTVSSVVVRMQSTSLISAFFA
jgi:hypothetical protein